MIPYKGSDPILRDHRPGFDQDFDQDVDHGKSTAEADGSAVLPFPHGAFLRGRAWSPAVVQILVHLGGHEIGPVMVR